MEKQEKAKKNRKILAIALLILIIVIILLAVKSCSRSYGANTVKADSINATKVSDSKTNTKAVSTKTPNFASEDLNLKTGDSNNSNTLNNQNNKEVYYFVNFVDDDGTVLQRSTYLAGTMPSYDKTVKNKEKDGYKYTFIGWDKAITVVEGAQTYTATYSKEKINTPSTPSTPVSVDPIPTPSSPTQPTPLSTHTITSSVNSTTGGSVSGIEHGGIYNENATVTLTATANTDNTFVKWSDGVTDNPRTIIVNEDKDYKAIFAPNKGAIITLNCGEDADHGSLKFRVFSQNGTEIKVLCIDSPKRIDGLTIDDDQPFVYKDSIIDSYLNTWYENCSQEIKDAIVSKNISQEVYTDATSFTYDSSYEIGQRFVYVPNISDYIDYAGGVSNLTCEILASTVVTSPINAGTIFKFNTISTEKNQNNCYYSGCIGIQLYIGNPRNGGRPLYNIYDLETKFHAPIMFNIDIASVEY